MTRKLLELVKQGKENLMNLESHIDILREKNFEIQRMINEEALRNAPDLIYISKLKKRKLMIRDEISRLENETDFISA